MKFYRALILMVLMTSGFGFPRTRRDTGDEQLDQLVDTLEEGTKIQQDVIKVAANSSKKIQELLKEVERKIKEMAIDIGVVNANRMEITKKAIDTLIKSKTALKLTRNKLTKLADKTVLSVNDLIVYMEAWDSENYSVKEQKEYLKEQAVIMEKLLIESKAVLSDAKNDYFQASLDMNGVDFQLKAFIKKMSKMLDKESAEHKSWTAALRLGVYSGAYGVTLAMMFADLLGCLGLCSAIGTTATLASSVTAVEVSISKVSDQLENLNEVTSKAITKVAEVSKYATNLQDQIQKENNVIIRWENAVEHMDDNLEKIEEESFYRLSLRRKTFTNGLIGLRKAAEYFIDPSETEDDNELDFLLVKPDEEQKYIDQRKFVLKMKHCLSNNLKPTVEECTKYASE